MAETTKMTLIIAQTDGEGSGFLIAGAIDYGISDVIGMDEYNEMVDKMKRNYDPDLVFYDWREIIVSLPDSELAQYFETPEMTATVEGLDPGYPNATGLAETLLSEDGSLD